MFEELALRSLGRTRSSRRSPWFWHSISPPALWHSAGCS